MDKLLKVCHDAYMYDEFHKISVLSSLSDNLSQYTRHNERQISYDRDDRRFLRDDSRYLRDKWDTCRDKRQVLNGRGEPLSNPRHVAKCDYKTWLTMKICIAQWLTASIRSAIRFFNTKSSHSKYGSRSRFSYIELPHDRCLSQRESPLTILRL